MKVQKNTDYVSNANDVTRISAGVRLEGRLVSAGDVRVDGDVDGILYSGGRIVVGEGAGISGSIYCTNLDLLGKLHDLGNGLGAPVVADREAEQARAHADAH